MPSKTPRFPASGLNTNGTTFVALVMLSATLFLLWHTFSPVYDTVFATAGRGPVFFPRILLGIMALLSVLVAGQSLLQKDRGGFSLEQLFSVGLGAAATGAYLYLIYGTGYLLASIVFSVALPVIFGYRRWPVVTTFAMIYPTVTWYVFEKIFRIVLPKSPWFISF